ncbi:winged helix-turn-helix domain-containing protein [Trinickia fusca]|uniref:DNA-binding response regulator n=1 Tax=Trinickia fusca TaxID=2419777 RepID=A0A494XKU8_9BURK|nr:winged helix-turn-helix domain-containing protein [Trinickia fusca]RKP48163.1 DNA-binding response regulator [Trinickia fusca]
MRTLFISRRQPESDWLEHALRESAHSVQRIEEIRDGVFLAGQEYFNFLIVMALEPSTYPSLLAAVEPLSVAGRGAILVALLGPSTARDRSRILRAGADACFSQPHSFLELHEHLQALRRLRLAQNRDAGIAQHDLLELDAKTRELRSDDRRIALTQREFMVIECLLREPGVPVSRAQLIGYAWPESDDADPASVNFIVSRLRRKLARDLPRVRIDTVSHHGYRIVLLPPPPATRRSEYRQPTHA